MSTTVKIDFTANAAEVVLDGGRTVGIPSGQPLADMRRRDPVAWVAIQEFQQNGTTSGTVTVAAA